VLRPEKLLREGQQRGELVTGPRRIPRLARPEGEVAAGAQSLGVLGPQKPLHNGQHGGELVAGDRCIAR
jgi:hypothetical protein